VGEFEEEIEEFEEEVKEYEGEAIEESRIKGIVSNVIPPSVVLSVVYDGCLLYTSPSPRD